MIEENKFQILRKIKNKNNCTQRELSKKVGFSLGKLNYCLKKLKDHGLIKVKRFKNSKNKIGYIYLLTPRGINQRTKLTLNYMKLKIKEYDELKKELIEKKK
tara:strand:+ start:764 stop:1069 length:306 start_codon:yes stop_codon:yes gene_type:complete